MESFFKKIIILFFITDIFLFGKRIFLSSKSADVLSFTTQTPTVTPYLVPSPTLTPIPLPTQTPFPTLTNTPIPTPTPVHQPQFSQEEIHGFIERFAAQYSVDPNVLRHLAVCESGFNASAVNGPYVGLFQFGVPSWQSNRILMGEDTDPDLRFNAEESVQTASFIISKGIKQIWPNCYP